MYYYFFSEENRTVNLSLEHLLRKPKIFDHDFAAIHTHKTSLKLNRPVYVRMSILDLSKHLMFDYYYNHLNIEYGDRCNLLYTDTNSLLLDIKTKDIYADMARDANLYDFSKDHFHYSYENKQGYR